MKTKTCSKTKIVLAVIFSVMLTMTMMPIDVQAAAKPAQVKSVKAYKVTTTSISLKWKKAKRAKYYRVYKKSGSKYKKVATVKGYSKTKYTVKKLKAGKKYTFKVRAIRKSGKKNVYGKYSKALTARTIKVTASWKIGAANQNEPERYDRDTATDAVMATLYSDGKLAITGTGNTQALYVAAHPPWYKSRTSVKKATIASTVTNTNISGWFMGCSNLVSAPVIPAGVKYMNSTFEDCSDLTTAPVIPNGVIGMGSTFEDCSNLTKAPVIPDSVKYMNSTFAECESLTTAPKIPDSVTYMNATFEDCEGLTSAPAIPKNVSDMTSTFYGCSNLTKAPAIPPGVVNMEATFGECESLTAAPEIPNSVTNMNLTFFECESLITAPKIPINVTNMNATFAGCSALTGEMMITAAPTQYNYCFDSASTNTGTKLTVDYDGTKCTQAKAEEIIKTKSTNSNIILGTQK